MKKRNKAAAKELYFVQKKKSYQYRSRNPDKAERITNKRRAMYALKAKNQHKRLNRYNRLMKKAQAKR